MFAEDHAKQIAKVDKHSRGGETPQKWGLLWFDFLQADKQFAPVYYVEDAASHGTLLPQPGLGRLRMRLALHYGLFLAERDHILPDGNQLLIGHLGVHLPGH